MARYSKVKISSLFKRGDNATTTKGKGEALEDLVTYLFTRVPGITLSERDALNVFQSEEIDLGFWNKKSPLGFYFLDHIILAECKNWSQPVGAAEVSWFINKLRLRGVHFGVLIAAHGISNGHNGVGAAQEIVRVELAQQRTLVVITRTEIEQLNDTAEFIEMIQRKMTKLVVTGAIV